MQSKDSEQEQPQLPPPITSPPSQQQHHELPVSVSTDERRTMTSQLLSKIQLATSQKTAVAAVRVYLIRHGETNWNLKRKIQGGGYDVPLNENGKHQAQMAARALEGIPLDAVASSSLSRAKETADIIFEHYNRNNNKNDNKKKKTLRIVDPGFNEMRFGKFEGFGYQRKQGSTGGGNGIGTSNSEDEIKLTQLLVAKQKVNEDPQCCFPSRGSSDNINSDDEVYRVKGNDSGKGESTRIVEDRAMEALSKTISRVCCEAGSSGEHESNATTTKHVVIVSHGRTNKIMISAMLHDRDTTTIGQGNANITVLDHPGWEEEGSEHHDISGKGGWIARIINYTDHVEE